MNGMLQPLVGTKLQNIYYNGGKKMICRCGNCKKKFEATGEYILEVLIGAVSCPTCNGTVNHVYAKRKG
jgi:hypothetical protein